MDAVAAHSHSLFLDGPLSSALLLFFYLSDGSDAASGGVWAVGSAEHGELGVGAAVVASSGPSVRHAVRVAGALAHVRVVRLASRLTHCLALDAHGSLWAWGSHLHRQLGLPLDAAAAYEPMQVPLSRPVIAAAAGAFHSLALDDQGTVWAWGANRRGQLGLGSAASVVAMPTRVPMEKLALTPDERIVDVHCGHEFSALRSDRGRLWLTGCNALGQLALSQLPPPPLQREFVAVQRVAPVAAVSLGYAHVLAACHGEQEGVWGWGSGTEHQLGPQRAVLHEPTHLLALPPRALVTLSAGETHSLVMVEEEQEQRV